MRSTLRFELTTPLLFANFFRSVSPDLFLSWELNAGSAGSVTLPLEADTKPESIKAVADGGANVPISVSGRRLRFFAGAPGIVRVNDGRREIALSLTLPEVATAIWTPPSSARRGVPESMEGSPVARDLWQWLALAGGFGLLLEWWLFGRARRLFRVVTPRQATPLRKAS
jgi:hypothetical protein